MAMRQYTTGRKTNAPTGAELKRQGMNITEITLQRIQQSPSGEETIGKLTMCGRYECWVLEDQHREVKVKGDTRIPAGRYEIKLRPAGRIHENYLAKFGADFHKGTLHLQDVPNFQYILIHIGNTEKDTDGCLLTGKSYSVSNGHFLLQNSTVAYKELYAIVRDELLSGVRVFISVYDEV
jgi:hypothetical protein